MPQKRLQVTNANISHCLTPMRLAVSILEVMGVRTMGLRTMGLRTRVMASSVAGLRLFCATMLLGLSLSAHADDSSPAKIGFVDIPYLIERAPQALDAEQRLEAEFAPRHDELEAQRSDLAALTARLTDGKLELPEADQLRLDRETRSLERRIKRSEQDFREELNIQKNSEFKKVRILVLEAIASFGKQNDYDLIVSDGVLFANKRIDVTERILENLEKENARLQSKN